MTPALARSVGGIAALIVILIAAVSLAAQPAAPGADSQARRLLSAGEDVVHGGQAPGAAKAATDTVLVLGPWGSGAAHNGQFQTTGGAPAWNGWTSIDLTQRTEERWHAATDGALAGSFSAWCGTLAYGSCEAGDPEGGYGNSWNELLEWRGTVADPGASCTVDLTATIAIDTEPGYDYAYVTAVKSGGAVDLWVEDGVLGPMPLALQTVYAPGDYVGGNDDEVVVQFRFTSDGAWSDQDCLHPTDGAVRLDDVAFTLDNGAGYAHGFEDGTLGDLLVVLPQGVGDFAKLWQNLAQPGHCGQVNPSPMVAFIDDGVVVPGTGGTQCISHCYGPGGFIVNNSGGLAGPDAHIHNAIESPVMAWPGPGYEGALLEFDVWEDETLGPHSPGVFYTWSVRSTTAADPAAIATEPWRDRNFVHYGGPRWNRRFQPVGDLIPADASWVQVQLAVYELGWVHGFIGSDGTPAPYFDNVRLAAYPHHGPSLVANVADLPHDTFPESGTLDLVNLGANNIRFDSGNDITSYSDPRNDPGDSVLVTVKPQRDGASLVGMPRLHWSLKRNPAFDPYRSAGLPDQGWIEGWQPLSSGQPVPNRFAFDLPDTGFLFPGDFLYYYFSATDEAGGVQQTSTLPADTTGFSDFADPMAYPPIYKLHALPTLTEDPGEPGTYTQPTILFWDDAGAVGNRDEWYTAYRNLGLVAGVDYDIYYTSNPSAGTGHGLGGRATAAQLAGYSELIYTSGVQTRFTIGDGGTGSNSDRSLDAQVLTAWLEQGGKDMLLTGDDLAGDIARNGDAAATAFLQDWMGVDLVSENVLVDIGLQTTPLIRTVPLLPVFTGVEQWRGVANCLAATAVYYGGDTSTGNKRYDGVVPRVGAVRLAEFTDPSGTLGQYPYSAATLNVRADFGARVISLPYDFQSVETADGAKADAQLAARVRLLQDVLAYFGAAGGSGTPSAVPDAGVLFAGNHPNPFNPATTISWWLPQAGHLGLEVFDVRGRLVRTLADGPAPAGAGEVRWDGRAGDGRAAAAGVYFYRLQAGDETLVGKMALIK
ncbi:MAG: FlgD immunoglobulin-like domain containing protein [Candidatus Krumholzibacteriia bacterium]